MNLALRLDPPATPGNLRAFSSALFMHALLIVALAWGVHWRNSNPQAIFQAELWSSLPQEAAPQLVEAAPELPPTPTLSTHSNTDSDIALARRLEKERLQRQAEEEAQRRAAEELREHKKQEAKNRAREAQLRDSLRTDNLKRILGQAGANGAKTAKGQSQKASGPSPEYAGRIRARIKPNIVFTENIPGNPTAVVEVHCTADGNIVSKRLLQSSGYANWDNAALNGIEKTRVLPRDIDGQVPSPMIIEFRPKD